MRLNKVLLTLLCFASTPVLASQPFGLELRGGPTVLSGFETSRFGFSGDNDSWALAFEPDGTQFDRWYSTGSTLFYRFTPRGFETIRGHPTRVLTTVSARQTIDTPRSTDIATSAELQGDRPYAGWLALSLATDVVFHHAPLLGPDGARDSYAQISTELYAGVTGPMSLAGFTQSTSHRISHFLNPDPRRFHQPAGWGVAETVNAPAFDSSTDLELPVVALDTSAPRWLETSGARPGIVLHVAVRADLGTTLGALAANATLTGGLLGDPLAREKTSAPFTLYAFARIEGRLVGWNRNIEAPLVSGQNEARIVHEIFEASAGIAARYRLIELTWSQTYRSNEVATLPANLQTGQLLGQAALSFVFE